MDEEIQKVRLLIDNEEFNEAEKQLDAILKDDPSNGLANRLKIYLEDKKHQHTLEQANDLINNGQFPQARAMLESLLTEWDWVNFAEYTHILELYESVLTPDEQKAFEVLKSYGWKGTNAVFILKALRKFKVNNPQLSEDKVDKIASDIADDLTDLFLEKQTSSKELDVKKSINSGLKEAIKEVALHVLKSGVWALIVYLSQLLIQNFEPVQKDTGKSREKRKIITQTLTRGIPYNEISEFEKSITLDLSHLTKGAYSKMVSDLEDTEASQHFIAVIEEKAKRGEFSIYGGMEGDYKSFFLDILVGELYKSLLHATEDEIYNSATPPNFNSL